jgi:Protein of unknown function (DUF998)
MSSRRRASLACGMIAGPLFVGAFTLEGARRPDYEPGRHPVSSLSLGRSGWTQKLNFLTTGALTVAFAAGLRDDRDQRWLPRLVGMVGTGLVGAGVFDCDPIGGYPPGTPDLPAERTVHGVLHDVASTPVFVALPVACAISARRFASDGERALSTYSAASGLAFAGSFVMASRGFAGAGGGGRYQRAALITGFGWMGVLAAVRFARTAR